MTIEDRVECGILFLDQHFVDWRARVKAERLDIRSGEHCVLGQCHGSWPAAAMAVQLRLGLLPNNWYADHGFVGACDCEIQSLNREWVRRLTEPAAVAWTHRDAPAPIETPELVTA